MVSLSDWEGGNYSAAKLGAEEGIRFFLLEKLTQIILGLVFILFLFFIYFIPKIIWRCGTIYKTLFSHMVFQFINVCLSKHWPCLTEMIWGGDNALAKHLAKPQLSVRQDPQSLFPLQSVAMTAATIGTIAVLMYLLSLWGILLYAG